MCGIFGYIGENKKPLAELLEGLKRLEYRGYDSAGAALWNGKGKIFSRKSKGRISALEPKLPLEKDYGIGIFHTRWATHGEPSDRNAHPHSDCRKNIFVAHNGIVENYKELRLRLKKLGHKFSSETDTEVVPHLLEEIMKRKPSTTLAEAVFQARHLLKGSYALVILSSSEEKIVAVRESSPLILGLGKGEYFVASDASAIVPYTREVVYLNDGECAVIERNSCRIFSAGLKEVKRTAQTIEWDVARISKQGFPHFMLKEIFEEPEAVENALRGRLIPKDGLAKLGGLENSEKELRNIKNLVITGCGTAYYAALVGEYMLEAYAHLPVEVHSASELRYREAAFLPATALLAVSQSGETADTLAALEEAKRKGILTLGIVNTVGSSISRLTEAGVYNHAGPEIAVASTKAFASQLAVLALLTLFLGRQRGMSLTMGKRIVRELQELPEKMRQVLKENAKIKKLADKYSEARDFFFLGRKYNYPIALEGALKLKEVSYIHAEGYGAGEMKHGPIALIDKDFPSFFIMPSDSLYEKNFSNAQEVKARHGKIIAIATAGDKKVAELADDIIYIPKTLEMLTPLLSVMPLHLFAYHLAVRLGRDVDKPRNLAKSVTVE